MSALARNTRRSAAGALVLLAIAGCSSQRPRTETSPAPPPLQTLSEPERIAHVLSRLTYGARPGDAERVAAMGVDRWIDQQLRPESIADSLVIAALAPIPAWTRPAAEIFPVIEERRIATTPMAMLMKDSATRELVKQVTVRLVALSNLDGLYAGKIIHAESSERQLLEVVSDFWENHFSVFSGKMPARETLIAWDRDVLRPRALGKFRDLLGAVAHSPAMLFYLDNHLSTKNGLNENYARELLELHTLGVDGGYTQHDVVDVARALTGWTLSKSRTPLVFEFRPELHDTGTKIVLGHTLRGGRGIEDGEEVLDIIAHNPSTARYIAFKLARRLVSDDPPPALVQRAAATFASSDGDITQVVRTIVTSPEFFSRAAFRAKVKTPFELVVSTRRALGATPDTSAKTARLIAQLGQPTFGWQAPDGWPERGGAWMNSGTMYKRITFASDATTGRLADAPIDRWREWSKLSNLPLNAQVDGVLKSVLGGFADPATREAMLAIPPPAPGSIYPGDGSRRLRDLLTIAFASPEFQRR